MVFAFSAAAGAYALGLGLAVLVAAIAVPGGPDWRRLGRLGAVAAGLTLLAVLPLLGSTLDFAQVVTDVFSSSSASAQDALGQLTRPLPLAEGAGVWLARDYRMAVEPAYSELNVVLVAVAIAMAVTGLVMCVARRRPQPLILLGTVALPAIALAPFVTPYAEAKLLVVLTPAVVLLAAFACIMLIQVGRGSVRVAGWVALAAVATGVLASDLFAYRETKLAPLDRMEAMEQAADRIPGNGLWLFNEWEEFGKYFMRSARINAASERDSPRRIELRRANVTAFGYWFDLDRQKLSHVQGFAGIVLRRSPEASRPPASFTRIYRNRYYELWKRDKRITVRRHLPLQGSYRATFPARCRAVEAMAEAARPGDRLVAARPAPTASLSPLLATLPGSWSAAAASIPGTVLPSGPGTMSGEVTTSVGGRTLVWLNTSGGRSYTVSIDGRRVGKAGQINTPSQWLDAGSVDLPAGRHRVEVTRAGASLRPGDAFRGHLGPVVLQSAADPRLVSVAPRNARRLCGRSWDWIELVRG